MADEVKTEKKTAAPKAEKASAPKAEKPKIAADVPNTKQLKVTLVKSTIGALEKQKRTVEALGLKKIRSFKIHSDTPTTRGMLFVVRHLVKVEEIVFRPNEK